jgi:hypothetical protein
VGLKYVGYALCEGAVGLYGSAVGEVFDGVE